MKSAGKCRNSTTSEEASASMLNAADLARSHWNEAPLYISEDERYSYYPWLYRAAEFTQHGGEHVLEIGCGTGADLLQFAKHGAVATGVDITPRHLELARERVAGKANVIEASATDLPFADSSFDYIYSHGVLHHIDRPERVAQEILRVLKPGGRFNIHVYARWSWFVPYLMARHGREWRTHIENSTAPVHIDLYTAKKLRRLFPVPLVIRKVSCPIEPLGKLLGWYLIATTAHR
jgi:SAM-dependent methyltransferase